MPHYEYQFTDDRGGSIEVFQMMSDPKLEQIDGRPVERLISVGRHQINMHENSGQYPYVSNALPTTIRGCKMVQERKKNGRLSRPKPLIMNKQHEKEVMAINDLVKD